MPKELFDLDDRDIKRLAKFYKKSPKQFQWVVANVLNDLAFGSRRESLGIIEDKMIVRSPTFVKRSISVDKARGAKNINSQFAETGSVERPNFTGWVEQETGKKSDRSRVATLFARGDNPQKKIKPSARMKRSNEFIDLNKDFPGKSRAQRTARGLQSLRMKKWKKPFIIRRVRLKGGIVRASLRRLINGRRMKTLQSFEHKNKQPKRIRWSSGGAKNYLSKVNIRQLMEREVTKQLEFKKQFKKR